MRVSVLCISFCVLAAGLRDSHTRVGDIGEANRRGAKSDLQESLSHETKASSRLAALDEQKAVVDDSAAATSDDGAAAGGQGSSSGGEEHDVKSGKGYRGRYGRYGRYGKR
eukprot:TRINITY_DN82251_c0_g1_i1.p2 TRINITY_DN82251_c0_g1~~TRINITY_DN82251_c0_g1_i1.p2  ORF type:complete len:111 (-),score=16.95 TRINITY_DN82251_c0_g1_i1:183-515(-)